MQTLADAGYELFLEIGPTDTMISMGKRCLPKGTGTWLASLKKDEDEWRSLLDSLATLYVSGADINWAEFDRNYPRRRVALPTYPFQRKRCWLEPSEIKSYLKK
jgi:acyl transferase domain-containing protein